MGQNERLKTSDVVLTRWTVGDVRYRIAFVDGQPKMESLIRGTWYMHRLGPDARAMMAVFIPCYVAALNFQIDRSKVEIKLARMENDLPRRVHWQGLQRKAEAELRDIPAPWNVQWRAKQ